MIPTSNQSPPAALLQIGMSWFPEQHGNGLDRYTFGLMRAFEEMDVRQRWLVMGSSTLSQTSGGVVRDVAHPTSAMITRMRHLRRAVRREIQRDSPQVIGTHFAPYAMPALSMIRNHPHIVHFHGPWSAESAREGGRWVGIRLKHEIERRVYASAGRLITLSRAFANILRDDYSVDEDRIRIIPGGIDAQAFDPPQTRASARELLGWPEDRAIVLCVRRLVHRMGLENLLDSVNDMRAHHPDFLLLIAGRGPLEVELRDRIKSGGLTKHVRLLGFVPDPDLPLAYRAADLSIVPTESLEGFGLITLESLAAGTPVLVTPIGGLPEAVSGLSQSLILGGTSAEEIAEGIKAALSGKLPLPSEEECKRYVKENFDWPIIAAKVLDVYREAMVV